MPNWHASIMENQGKATTITLVPVANFSNSNTPMGPFHMTVLVVSKASLNVLIESGPISRPIQPSGISDAATICPNPNDTIGVKSYPRTFGLTCTPRKQTLYHRGKRWHNTLLLASGANLSTMTTSMGNSSDTPLALAFFMREVVMSNLSSSTTDAPTLRPCAL